MTNRCMSLCKIERPVRDIYNHIYVCILFVRPNYGHIRPCLSSVQSARADILMSLNADDYVSWSVSCYSLLRSNHSSKDFSVVVVNILCTVAHNVYRHYYETMHAYIILMPYTYLDLLLLPQAKLGCPITFHGCPVNQESLYPALQA